MGLAAAAYDAIEWTVHPGSQSGSGGGSLYEDDGETTRYLPAEGAQFVWINTGYAWDASGAVLTLKVDADEGGGHEGRPLQRSHTFRLPLTLPPSSVSLDGKRLPYAPVWRARGELGDPSFRGAWTYDGDQLATIVHLPRISWQRRVSVTVATPKSAAMTLSGLSGAILAGRRAKATLDEARMAPGEASVDPLGSPLNALASAGAQFTSLASQSSTNRSSAAFVAAAASVRRQHSAALSQLKTLFASTKSLSRKARVTYAIQLLEAGLE